MMKMRAAALALAVSILSGSAGFQPASARAVLPEAVLKKPVAVVENSVSTYVPSSVAPGNGIAVNVIFPEKPRYKAGAPIAIVVSGNQSNSLSMSMHAANSGIAEVRFAYPGCGMRQFHSDGIFDNFGSSCSTALKDVILFMKGEINDYKGRSVRELIPVSLDQGVVGLVAWETGANIALVTMAKHQEKIPFISYLAFYEGAAGAMFYPDNLGTVKDMILNRHYREGSAATGEILVDYRKLMYSPNSRRNPGVAKKRGDAELKGVLYFDENNNKTWDESSEFALNYASEVGLDKQIYAPPITMALLRHSVFLKSIPAPQEEKPKDDKDKKNDKEKNSDDKKSDDRKSEEKKSDNESELKGKGGENSKDRSGTAKKNPILVKSKEELQYDAQFLEAAKQIMATNKGIGLVSEHATKSLREENGKSKNPTGFKIDEMSALKLLLKRKRWYELARWPSTIALPNIANAYFEARDGALHIKQVCEGYPDLLVGLFGAHVAHTQRQADHPHIALLYNKFLECKPKWLRLNPEPIYISTICRMNVNNFQANEPGRAIDATNIVEHLAPLGLVPEYAYMDALVAELSDRAKSGNLKFPLTATLCEYTPIPDPSKVEPKPETKTVTEGSKETAGKQTSSKEAASKEAAGEKGGTKTTP